MPPGHLLGRRLLRTLELVARAHKQFGDIAAANAVRGRVPGRPLVLDERALEYLDLRGGMTVPAPRDRAEEIRCTHDFSRCELDTQLLASEFDPSVLLRAPSSGRRCQRA